jgi:hypothetical protein
MVLFLMTIIILKSKGIKINNEIKNTNSSNFAIEEDNFLGAGKGFRIVRLTKYPDYAGVIVRETNSLPGPESENAKPMFTTLDELVNMISRLPANCNVYFRKYTKDQIQSIVVAVKKRGIKITFGGGNPKNPEASLPSPESPKDK